MSGTHYTGTIRAYNRAQALQNMPWYTIDDIGGWINDVANITFKVAAARQTALDGLTTMIGDAPYDVAPVGSGPVRFGSATVDSAPPLYICSTWGPFNKIFQQLRAALMYKEPLSAQNPSSSGPPAAGRSTFAADDAQQAFNNGLTALMTELSTANNLFNQGEFEKTFRLTWSA